MKYMGSKRFMLGNGLGELIKEQLPYANRVVDPFCGAGSVVYFAAQHSNKKIIAGDLQKYAVVLANAAMALHCTGNYKTYDDAFNAAIESLESGKAKKCLDKLISLQ